jgi:hypothetical protein
MQICTRSLARVKPHMFDKAHLVLLHHIWRSRRDFDGGWLHAFTPGRRFPMPKTRLLDIVPMDPPVYLSTYSHHIDNPATCVLDRI